MEARGKSLEGEVDRCGRQAGGSRGEGEPGSWHLTKVPMYVPYLGNVGMASMGCRCKVPCLDLRCSSVGMPRLLIGQFHPAITQNRIDQDKSKAGSLGEAFPNLYFNSYRRCQYGYLCRHLPVLLFRSRLWPIILKDEYLKRAAGQDIPGAPALIIPWHKRLNTNERKNARTWPRWGVSVTLLS